MMTTNHRPRSPKNEPSKMKGKFFSSSTLVTRFLNNAALIKSHVSAFVSTARLSRRIHVFLFLYPVFCFILAFSFSHFRRFFAFSSPCQRTLTLYHPPSVWPIKNENREMLCSNKANTQKQLTSTVKPFVRFSFVLFSIDFNF